MNFLYFVVFHLQPNFCISVILIIQLFFPINNGVNVFIFVFFGERMETIFHILRCGNDVDVENTTSCALFFWGQNTIDWSMVIYLSYRIDRQYFLCTHSHMYTI